MIVEVVGPGCARCDELYARAVTAASELGIACKVEKVGDLGLATSRGILLVPALVVNGAVKTAGRVPPVAEIKEHLRGGAARSLPA